MTIDEPVIPRGHHPQGPTYTHSLLWVAHLEAIVPDLIGARRDEAVAELASAKATLEKLERMLSEEDRRIIFEQNAGALQGIPFPTSSNPNG